MSIAVFVIGVLVFLITVYGTVMVGGLFLTDRQFDEQPELMPDGTPPKNEADSDVDRARGIISSEY